MIMAYPDTVPLDGPFRLPLLILNLGLILAALNVALLYIKKYITLKDSVKGTRVHAAWFSLFLGYAVMVLMYWFGALYTSRLADRFHVLQFGYLSAATGALFFIFFIEQLTYITARRVFTLVFGALYVVLVILTLVSFVIDLGNFIQYFATCFWIPNLGFIGVYMHKINQLSRGALRGIAFFMLLGFVLLILGILGSTDIIQRSLGLGIRLLADIFQIGGVLIIGIFSTRVPSWKELEWVRALHSLFVIYKGGILIYEHEFGDEGLRIDQGKVTTAVSVLEATRMFLNAAIDSGELKIIDFQEKKLYFETGEHVTVVMVVNEQLETIRFMIHKIRSEFEKMFASILHEWSGDASEFTPASAMINQVLS
jgi:hypothetical protein